jgi:hypothetical protein
VTHLTEQSYRLLLQGSLPPAEARLLARHLEEACDVCEEFLASRPTADAADGLVDEALGALVPAGGRGSDLEFARIVRRVREGAGPPRRRTRGLAPAAIAAAVLAAGLAGLLVPREVPEPSAWDGVKGASPRAIPVRLRFLVVAPSPAGPPALEKGVPGQAVGRAASLQFEIESGRAAYVALLRVAAGGAPEVVWSERVGEGRSPVAVEGRPAAYPLADLAGPQRFVLVASGERLDGDRIARAAAALAPPARVRADLAGLDGLSIDVVEVEVR